MRSIELSGMSLHLSLKSPSLRSQCSSNSITGFSFNRSCLFSSFFTLLYTSDIDFFPASTLVLSS